MARRQREWGLLFLGESMSRVEPPHHIARGGVSKSFLGHRRGIGGVNTGRFGDSAADRRGGADPGLSGLVQSSTKFSRLL